jgi:hypothetical protein
MDINCILACGLSSEVTILLCLLCNISPLLSRRAVKKVLWTLRWPIIMQVWVTYIFKKLVFLFEKLMTNKNYDYPVPLLYASIGFWATFVSVFQVCNSRIIVPTPCCFFVGTGPTRKLFASEREYSFYQCKKRAESSVHCTYFFSTACTWGLSSVGVGVLPVLLYNCFRNGWQHCPMNSYNMQCSVDRSNVVRVRLRRRVAPSAAARRSSCVWLRAPPAIG